MNLTEVLHFLDLIPNINFGGCGIAALAMERWLRAQGVRAKKRPFVVRMDDTFGLRENKEAIKNRTPLHRCPHIVLSRRGKYYDSTGDVTDQMGWQVELEIDEETLVKTLNDHGWNPLFDRDVWIPYIEEYLDIDLGDIEY